MLIYHQLIFNSYINLTNKQINNETINKQIDLPKNKQVSKKNKSKQVENDVKFQSESFC